MSEVGGDHQRLKFSVLNINIHTPMPKNENLQKQFDEKREMGKHPCGLHESGLPLPPGEEKTWQDEGGEKETAERGKPWRQSGVGEGYVMTWKSQLVAHARLWLCEWQSDLGAWPPPTWHWLQPGSKE